LRIADIARATPSMSALTKFSVTASPPRAGAGAAAGAATAVAGANEVHSIAAATAAAQARWGSIRSG